RVARPVAGLARPAGRRRVRRGGPRRARQDTQESGEMITVIGLGPMGQAMVRTLVKAGHPTTVWNRTPSRADGLGAVIAPSVTEALAANDLVVLSLTDYQAMYDILDGQRLTGKVIVNLSSDSTSRTREA